MAMKSSEPASVSIRIGAGLRSWRSRHNDPEQKRRLRHMADDTKPSGLVDYVVLEVNALGYTITPDSESWKILYRIWLVGNWLSR